MPGGMPRKLATVAGTRGGQGNSLPRWHQDASSAPVVQIPTCGNGLLLVLLPVLGHIVSKGVIWVGSRQQRLDAAGWQAAGHRTLKHQPAIMHYQLTFSGDRKHHNPVHSVGRV